MAKENSAAGQRRTQEERSTATRQRLLDATIECLVEFGYAGTTTSKVAERAGVTRGAQVHHYPTRTDLVTAAVRHLALKRANEALQRVDTLRGSGDVLDAAMELLWEVHQGPMFAATMELWVAGRTDPDVRALMSEVEPMVDAGLLTFGAELLPELAEHPQLRRWAYTAMDMIRGVLVAGPIIGDDALEQRWRRVKEHLRLLARDLFGPETLARLATEAGETATKTEPAAATDAAERA